MRSPARPSLGLALLLLALPACDKPEVTQVKQEARKLILTSPQAKDVTITQQYVCQIHSRRHINVRALENGYLDVIPVKEGQKVKEGDVLFKVVPVLYQAKLDAELAEARIRSLVEDQRFFESHWLAAEGLIDIERFSAMFGIFGLAEAVSTLLSYDGLDARYGHDEIANEWSYRIIERCAELVATRPLPYCNGGGGHAYLHSQGGLDSDVGVTAGTRIPVGDEPGMRQHITACAPHHRHFASGISDIFHVDETACRNPQAMVDIIKGAFAVGMRDFTFNLDSNEFIRITGYLVRKSDLVDIDTVGARHGSDYLAAGSERTFHLSERAVKRVGCHELDPRPGH